MDNDKDSQVKSGGFTKMKKEVWFYLAAWFALQFSFAGVYAVLINLYLTRLGYGIDFIGIVNSAGALGFAAFAIPAGMIGAKLGYQKTVMIGLFGGTLFSLFLPLAAYLTGSPLTSAGIVICYGLFSVSLTLAAVNGIPFLAGLSDDKSRVHVFSAYSAVPPLAGFFGSIIAGFLPKLFSNMLGDETESVFSYSASLWIVPALLLITALLLYIVSVKKNRDAAGSNTQESGATTKESKTPAPIGLFLSFFIVTVLSMSAFWSVFAFFSVYLDGALKISVAIIGILTAISRLIPSPSALLAPFFVKRLGNFRLLIIIAVTSALFTLPVGLSTSLAAAIVSLIVVSVLNAIASSAYTTLHQTITPVQWRSLMSGFVFSAEAISYAVVAFSGGLLIKQLGYQYFFLMAAGLTLTSGIVFWLLLHKKVTALGK